MDPFHETVFKGFAADGEDAVRNNLALKRYGTKHAAMAQEWLRRQEASRKEASHAESLSIARSAKDAAWDAAEAAREANTTARIAVALAAIAIVVSIIAIYIKAD